MAPGGSAKAQQLQPAAAHPAQCAVAPPAAPSGAPCNTLHRLSCLPAAFEHHRACTRDKDVHSRLLQWPPSSETPAGSEHGCRARLTARKACQGIRMPCQRNFRRLDGETDLWLGPSWDSSRASAGSDARHSLSEGHASRSACTATCGSQWQQAHLVSFEAACRRHRHSHAAHTVPAARTLLWATTSRLHHASHIWCLDSSKRHRAWSRTRSSMESALPAGSSCSRSSAVTRRCG
jgi:hypothetical protein